MLGGGEGLLLGFAKNEGAERGCLDGEDVVDLW
jgi:hypothetical protein